MAVLVVVLHDAAVPADAGLDSEGGVLLVAGFLLLVGYSGVRASLRGSERTISALSGALVQSAASANVSGDNLRRDLFYQDAATNSMFIIDSYPETYAQQPLRGLVWFVTNPIPRSMWPAKPNSRGGSARPRRIVGNIAPGSSGTAESDGSASYYAAFFGFVMEQIGCDPLAQPFFVTAMDRLTGHRDEPRRCAAVLPAGHPGTLTAVMYGCKLASEPSWRRSRGFGRVLDPEEARRFGRGDSPGSGPGETAGRRRLAGKDWGQPPQRGTASTRPSCGGLIQLVAGCSRGCAGEARPSRPDARALALHRREIVDRSCGRPSRAAGLSANAARGATAARRQDGRD